jgi:hypothetical protein
MKNLHLLIFIIILISCTEDKRNENNYSKNLYFIDHVSLNNDISPIYDEITTIQFTDKSKSSYIDVTESSFNIINEDNSSTSKSTLFNSQGDQLLSISYDISLGFPSYSVTEQQNKIYQYVPGSTEINIFDFNSSLLENVKVEFNFIKGHFNSENLTHSFLQLEPNFDSGKYTIKILKTDSHFENSESFSYSNECEGLFLEHYKWYKKNLYFFDKKENKIIKFRNGKFEEFLDLSLFGIFNSEFESFYISDSYVYINYTNNQRQYTALINLNDQVVTSIWNTSPMNVLNGKYSMISTKPIGLLNNKLVSYISGDLITSIKDKLESENVDIHDALHNQTENFLMLFKYNHSFIEENRVVIPD